MHRASVSWTTFLVRASLAGVLAALPLALQGCAAFTCFEGDPGCGSASISGSGAGATSVSGSGGTGTGGTGNGGNGAGGNGTGGTGNGGNGTGGVAHCDTCWGGDCVEGKCQPLVIKLASTLHAGRIAATKFSVYAVATDSVDMPAKLRILKIDFQSVTGPDGVLLPGNHKVLDTMIEDDDATPAFITAKGDDLYLSPQTALGLRHCTFAGAGQCVAIPDAVDILYTGLTLGNATDLEFDSLSAVHGDFATLGVTQYLPVDPYTWTPNQLSEPGQSIVAEASHAIAVGPDGRLAWSLYGDSGCVAVGKHVGEAATECLSKCLVPTLAPHATGVAIDEDSNIFYVAEDADNSNGGYALFRAIAKSTPGCAYANATLYQKLGLASLSQGVATSGKSVFVVADDPTSDADTDQVVLRCPTTGEASDCPVVVKLQLESAEDSVSLAATPDGIFFASDRQIGWMHL